MSTRSFGSLFMVASCAGAALGCYLVSLRVASERAALEDVETEIVVAQRDMRVIQTEIGTRGRLSQLERWNAGAFSLTAPTANQFVQGGFELAKLTQPQRDATYEAPVVLASARAPVSQKQLEQDDVSDATSVATISAGAMLHQASLKTETREVPARTIAKLPLAVAMKSADGPVTAAKPAKSTPAGKPGLAAAKAGAGSAPASKLAMVTVPPKKSVDKLALHTAKPMTKPVQLAKNDPLAPLPAKHSGKTKDATTGR